MLTQQAVASERWIGEWRAAECVALEGSHVAALSLEAGRVITVALAGELDGVSGPIAAERLARRYARQGAAAFDDLTGGFAVALWDTGNRTLVLARDRFGQQPLFIRRKQLAFASDLGVLATRVRAAPDRLAITDYLLFNFPLAPRSYYEGIEMLAPGTIMTIRAGQVQLRRCAPINVDPDEDIADEVQLERLLVERIERDRAAAVFHLSGGVDSSLLCHLAARTRTPATLTAFYGEGDELQYARRVAGELGAHAHELLLHAEDLRNDVVALSIFSASPIMAAGVPTFFRLARATALAGYGAAVSGIGADHPFVGSARVPRDLTKEALFEACVNTPLALFEEHALSGRWQQAIAGARWRFAAAIAPGLPPATTVERFFFDHFLQEHLRMAACAHARWGVRIRSPFLDARVQRLLSSLVAAAPSRAHRKEPLRALLRRHGSCAADRADKAQMTLSAPALARETARALRRDIADGLRLPGLDYGRLLRCAAAPEPSKMEARLLWLIFNLHQWFRRIGRVATELD